MDIKPEILERLKKLQEKYGAMGQDLASYLDGLLHSDHLTYWDYIHLDVLLNLQTPRTSLPDEKIFILYHQVTELYFKLILLACEEVAYKEPLDAVFFSERVRRINTYFRNLTRSFEIMIDGMEKEQFLKFRMALLPASGFQSAQYRMIEICSTDLVNLAAADRRGRIPAGAAAEDLLKELYWMQGATELATGRKTLTLRIFEEKYGSRFRTLAREYRERNLLARYRSLPETERSSLSLVQNLRELDTLANIEWPLVHYKSAVRYLQREPEEIAATGGTNWQKYLPPRHQKIIFFPDLWSGEEKGDWGKKHV